MESRATIEEQANLNVDPADGRLLAIKLGIGAVVIIGILCISSICSLSCFWRVFKKVIGDIYDIIQTIFPFEINDGSDDQAPDFSAVKIPDDKDPQGLIVLLLN
jgi:hypothetical protein